MTRPVGMPGRRAFLLQAGRTALGLVVVGGGLAACTDDDPTVAATDPTAGPTGTGGTATGPGAAGAGGAEATPATGSEDGATEGATDAGATSPLLVDLGFVAAYVLARDGEAAIVDTGVAGSEGTILSVLEAAGLGWDDVGHVIVTHSHPDHAGSLAAVAEQAGGAALYGGAADIPAMSAPREVQAVGDGDTVFGLRIVETPGHTPGHLAVHDPVAGLLVVGDALTGAGGGLTGPNAEFTADMATAIASVAKLAALDVREVLVGHGFPVTAGTAELQELAASL